jgi:hypothetical protein
MFVWVQRGIHLVSGSPSLVSALLLTRALVPRSKVVHYIGNRVQFGTFTGFTGSSLFCVSVENSPSYGIRQEISNDCVSTGQHLSLLNGKSPSVKLNTFNSSNFHSLFQKLDTHAKMTVGGGWILLRPWSAEQRSTVSPVVCDPLSVAVGPGGLKRCILYF